MFDGKTLSGWKANNGRNPGRFAIAAVAGDGEASHLFWMVQECENCEFKAEVKISHGGDSGMLAPDCVRPRFSQGVRGPGE